MKGQINRKVTVPDRVGRVAALQHQSLDVVVELDRLVGVPRSCPSLLPSNGWVCGVSNAGLRP